jgi:cytochrome c
MSLRLSSLGFAVLALAACSPRSSNPLWSGFGGDPQRGALVMVRGSCGACHEIPGIQAAHGLVGPPLAHFGRRAIVAGMLPNTPENLTHWIQHPQAVVPGNAMPEAGLTDQQARDAAAYLYSLR